MKRIKTIYPSSEIAHLWVYQQVDRAYNPGTKNFFFEGESIYSYGHHFEIARIVKPGIILFTSRSYSHTTAKHKLAVRYAIPDNFTVFTVPDFDNLKSNIDYYVIELNNLRYDLSHAIVKWNIENYRDNYIRLYNEFQDYTKTFKIPAKKAFRKLLSVSNIQILAGQVIEKRETAQNNPKLIEIREKRRIYAEKLKAKKIEEKRRKYLAEIEDWKAGLISHLPYSRPLEIDFIRFNESSGMIQTSQSVSVPVKLCRTLYNKIKNNEDIKGFKLNDYTVISYDNNVLKIGCHNIPKSEIDYIADLLKW